MSLHGKSSHEDNVIAEEIDEEENPATTKFVSTESEHQFYTEKVNLLQDKRRYQTRPGITTTHQAKRVDVEEKVWFLESNRCCWRCVLVAARCHK